MVCIIIIIIYAEKHLKSIHILRNIANDITMSIFHRRVAVLQRTDSRRF